MSQTSETGHAKNVANFENLITNLNGFGEVYNPVKDSITLPALTALLTEAKAAIFQVNANEPALKNAISSRDIAFQPLTGLISRVNFALKASASASRVDESVQTLIRKLQGRRAHPKMTEEEKKAAADEGKEVIEISVSQMSHDSRLDNFDRLIKLLASIPEYAPNEDDLNIAGLTALYNDLNAKNQAVLNARVTLKTARTSRNKILYTPITGLVDRALDVKMYVKSLYGPTSPEARQISKLAFKTIVL
jgi:hypothetical protein